MDEKGHPIKERAVLIETLWNVNRGTKERIEKLDLGINRNIVECKYDLHAE